MAEKRASQLFLKQVKISWPNLNPKLFISQESNIEKLVGVATLPSFNHVLWKIGILLHNRPPVPNILVPSVHMRYDSFFHNILRCLKHKIIARNCQILASKTAKKTDKSWTFLDAWNWLCIFWIRFLRRYHFGLKARNHVFKFAFVLIDSANISCLF